MDDPLHIRPVRQDGRSSAASATSSRAAANLSLERLYRKRAIDRENQRVLRQKNKARLAELESEVRTLTARLEQAEASHSVHSVQAAEAAEAAHSARSRVAQTAARAQSSSSSLCAIIASLQSLQVSLGELGELGDAAAALSATSESGDSNSNVNSIANSIASTTPGSSPVASASSIFTPSASAAASAAPTTSRSSISTTVQSISPSPTSNDGTLKGGHTPYVFTDRVMTGVSDNLWGLPGASVTVFDDSTPRNTDFSIDIDLLTRHLPISDEPVGKQFRSLSTSSSTSAYTFRNSITSSVSSASSLLSQTAPNAQATAEAAVYQAARTEANRLRYAVGSSPVWAVTPSYVPPTSGMDELLSLRGSAANAGLNASRLPPIQTVGGVDINGLPHLSSVHTLLNPIRGGQGQLSPKALPGLPPLQTSSSAPFAETSPTSSAIARQVASTITAYNTPERTALLYTICTYLRWLISPSQAHYDAIPDFLRPTAAQLVVPHPFWVDTIAWPLARDRVITHLDYTHAHTFSALFARTFSINWPHSLDGILQRSSTNSEDLVISPAFVHHVRDPANWSVGPELVDAFPFLDGAVSVRR
ncbi:bZIP transcription factor [Ophiostoma piceae UAMH 11346]|uniref:BZIP transcription factor n=1 Tax=Ophiostoma piceae (strain UAMH 11346) TaxID=1262450 RepID=S3CDC8_OPHP1|nr:bZIP transcription factor [Ophiostoma piceae UAMH 11346]